MCEASKQTATLVTQTCGDAETGALQGPATEAREEALGV